jgi:hypothetical protein
MTNSTREEEDMLKTACFFLLSGTFILMAAAGCLAKPAEEAEMPTSQQGKIHDPERPLPPVVDPGPAGEPVPAPSDSVVLFDGTDLSQWADSTAQPARWKVENGYMEVVKKAGSIYTKQKFGDCQLHIEWAAPLPPAGDGQEPGNSGVFLMEKYEVQVLDCYKNTTYADGMTAAIYGQHPPMVNACRPPGEWQTYDIIFHRPHWDAQGNLTSSARMTVFHNGVLVHHNAELTGPTAHKKQPPYERHPAKLSIMLQDHGHPVRFRNIWIRELE